MDTHSIPPIDCLTSFRSVVAEDIPLLQKFFNKYPSRSCDFSIGGVMMWVEYFHYELSLSGESLYIRGRMCGSDTRMYYACGPLTSADYAMIVSDYCRKTGEDGVLVVPSEHHAEEDITANVAVPTVDEWMEYLYDIDKFIGFPGKKMEKKRNHLNFFKREFAGCEIKAIGSDDIADIIAFTAKFAAEHDDSPLRRYEIKQTLDVLHDFGLYPFDGIVVRDGGKVIGYAFGERIGDTLLVHVEKGDIEYRGVYQALASEFCAMMKARYPELRYVNREEDMGFDDLRKSKLSYHPTLLIRKHLLSPRATSYTCNSGLPCKVDVVR